MKSVFDGLDWKFRVFYAFSQKTGGLGAIFYEKKIFKKKIQKNVQKKIFEK